MAPIRLILSGLRGKMQKQRRIPIQGGDPRRIDPIIGHARTAVLIGGLPESAARAAERHGDVDWRPLAAALDSLYVAKGGGLGVRRFLVSPHEELSGKVPVDVIERGDVQSVAMVAYRESAAVTLGRLC